MSIFLKNPSKGPQLYLSADNEAHDAARQLIKNLCESVRGSLLLEKCDDEIIWQQLELVTSGATSDLFKSLSLTKNTGVSLYSEAADDEDDEYGSDAEREAENDEDQESSDEESDVDNIIAGLEGGSDSDEDLKAALEEYRAATLGEGADDGSSDEGDLSQQMAKAQEDEVEGEENEEDGFGDSSAQQQRGQVKKEKVRKTEVDDRFFRLGEMEKWLEAEDAKEEKQRKKEDRGEQEEEEEEGSDSEDDEDENEEEEGEAEADWFADVASDENEEKGTGAVYADFFDAPSDTEQGKEETKKKKGGKSEASFRALGQDGEDNEAELQDEDEETDTDDDDKDKDDEEDDGDDEEDSEGERPEDILGGRKKNKLGVLSSEEQRLKKLREQVAKQEEDMVADKTWQEAGEVKAAHRPENSLLETHLDATARANKPPEITLELTEQIEKFIAGRIKDKRFDDVERKVRRVETAGEYRKRVELDGEKSKMSLAEVYEQEYLKQTQGEEEEKEDPRHEEIQKLRDDLFRKLDALANSHFTPLPSAPELRVVKAVPSLAMEEAAPVVSSTADTLAPEEVQNRAKGEVKGKEERTAQDKKRERRKKKRRQQAIHKAVEKKEAKRAKEGKVGKGQEEKQKVTKELERLTKEGRVTLASDPEATSGKRKKTSSTDFFSQLDSAKTTLPKKRKVQLKQLPGKKFKL